MDFSEPKVRITLLSVVALIAGGLLWWTGGLSPSQPDLPPADPDRTITVQFEGLPPDCDACAFELGVPVMGFEPVAGIALQSETGELKVTLREDMNVPNEIFLQLARQARGGGNTITVASITRSFSSEAPDYQADSPSSGRSDSGRATIQGSTITTDGS